MKKVLVLLLTACMLLSGCAADGEKDTADTTSDMTESTVVDNTEQEDAAVADDEDAVEDADVAVDEDVADDAGDAAAYTNNTEFYSLYLSYGIVSFYLPEGSIWQEGDALDEMDYSLWTDSYSSMISMGAAEFSPTGAERMEKVATSYGGSGYTLTEIDHEVFTHHLISEGDAGYYEVYLAYGEENPVSGEQYYFGVEVYVDLTADAANKDALVADFHTIVDSLDVTFITEEAYNEYWGF